MVAMGAAAFCKTLTLADLTSASVLTLRQWYAEIIGHTPPQCASALFMRSNLAWVLQVRSERRDPDALRDKLARSLSRALRQTKPRHSPGTRLVREWRGEVYEVTILPKGYLWQGRKYRSLSRIALEITGAKWSGPRFFGLKGASS
jgi:hypothetical protein